MNPPPPSRVGPIQFIMNPNPLPTQPPQHIMDQLHYTSQQSDNFMDQPHRVSQASQNMINPPSVSKAPSQNMMKPPSLPHASPQNTMDETPFSKELPQHIMNQHPLPTAPPQHMMDRLYPPPQPSRYIMNQTHSPPPLKYIKNQRRLPPPLSQNFFSRTHRAPTTSPDNRPFALYNASCFYTDVTILIALLKGKREGKLMRIKELQARRQEANAEHLSIMKLPGHECNAEQSNQVHDLYTEICSSRRSEDDLAYKSHLLKKMITELKRLRNDSPAAAGDQMYLISKILALKAHERINKNIYERLVRVMENLYGRIEAFYLPAEADEESDSEVEPMPAHGYFADPYDSDV